ncbi:MAG TPA: glycosyltransferase, partial [Tepidisphaeraceae bacterium]|nr:glycosyltransferase [Tepidisphaeraceae bacterium]
VDGGSTDGSADLIRRHAEAAPGAIDWWVSERDAGQADAIAKGFARATGDVLCWLNSDDVFLPGAIARARAAFDAHPDWDALTAWHVRMDADSRILSMHRIPAENPRLARWGIHHVNQQTCFFKRAAYEAVGGIDRNLHCVLDTDLWCRMFDRNTRWGHIPEYLAAFRQHATAKGTAWTTEYAQEEQWMRENHPHYCARTPKHALGQFAYRVAQVLTARHPRALADTRRHRGRTLTEVFG